MGGNAFDNLVRLDFDDYKEIENKCVDELNKLGFNVSKIPHYRMKESFGDLDLIIENDLMEIRKTRQKFEDYLSLKFGATRFHYNDKTVSFDYNGNFQVDLIFVDKKYFNSAIFYYSYNDLNNLVGRIAHKFGLSFGWQGLRYHIRNESGHKIKTITISKDNEDIYNFLGLDFERYLDGFDTLDDIFEFVYESRYFDCNIYDYENLNHTNKTRNRKRSTYRGFLEWIKKQPEKTYDFNKDKSIYIMKFAKFFDSDIFIQMQNIKKELIKKDKISSNFNGNIVMELTGLKGKDLGLFIKSFKDRYDDDYLMELSKNDVKYLINNFKVL